MVDASDVSGKDARPEAGRLAIPIFDVSSADKNDAFFGQCEISYKMSFLEPFLVVG